jgi:nicotinate phosphoribosyltransferase
VHVMGYEIFVLYIVNELYFRRFDQAEAMAVARARLRQKIDELRAFGEEAPRANPFEFFDFGVRRRFSGEWHDEVVQTLARELPVYFKGTSNVYLAYKFNLVPIGTMAHEYFYVRWNCSPKSRRVAENSVRAGNLSVARAAVATTVQLH